MEVPRLGSNWSCSSWPMPQPQQHQIWAVSATWTTAHSNAGSLTQRARPGIEPTTSWFLVGFVSAAPWWELLQRHFNSNWFWKKPGALLHTNLESGSQTNEGNRLWATLKVLKHHYLSHFLVKFIYLIELCVCVFKKGKSCTHIPPKKQTQENAYFLENCAPDCEDVCEHMCVWCVCECVCVCAQDTERDHQGFGKGNRVPCMVGYEGFIIKIRITQFSEELGKWMIWMGNRMFREKSSYSEKPEEPSPY